MTGQPRADVWLLRLALYQAKYGFAKIKLTDAISYLLDDGDNCPESIMFIDGFDTIAPPKARE